MHFNAVVRQLVIWIAVVSGTAGLAQSGPLRAGAAKVDITPTTDMYPLQDMHVYGSAHDPLYARALVLDNGTSKLAFVSIDTIHFPPGDALVKSITAELAIPASHLVLSATHDHNAPGLWDKPTANGKTYFSVLEQGVLAAVHQANASLQPACIGFGTGKAYVNVNRDEKIGEGYHMGYNPDGPSDKTVAVLLVTKPSGEPLAVYVNYPVHSVVMFLARTKDGQAQITGDLGGYTSRYVEERLKGAVALWTMGAAGDQNPLFMANYNQDSPDVHDEGAAGWAVLDEQSRRIGEEIVRVAGHVQNLSSSAVLWGAETTVTCPGQQRAEPPQPGVPTAGWQAPAHVRMVDGKPVTIPLHLAMVNDIAVAGVSGEVYTEIGQHVKADSVFDRTMLVTMMPNGIGYIPTDKAYLLPSEKAITNSIKPGCAEPAMLRSFKQLEDSFLAGQGSAQSSTGRVP